MADLLGTQKIYLDTRSIEKHQKIFDLIRSKRTTKDIKEYKKEDCDAKFFGVVPLRVALRSKMPLHFTTQTSDLEVDLSIIIGRVKEKNDFPKYDRGKNSTCTDSKKTFSLVAKNYKRVILSNRPVVSKDKLYSKWNNDNNRPNNIMEVLNNCEQGGSTLLSKSTITNLLLDRLASHDSGSFLCFNLYMWLQKCILYYSTENTSVKSKKMSCEVGFLSETFLHIAATNYKILVDTDNMTREEKGVLLIALNGHQNVQIADKFEPTRRDIYSSVISKKYPFLLCTRKKKSHTIEHVGNVMSPEVALSTIYSLVSKLGIISDWLSIPEFVRGISVMNKLTESLMDVSEIEVSSYQVDLPEDNLYGTVFGPLCNTSMGDRVEHTNLASGGHCLISEIIVGQSYMNNMHYICESIGLYNKKLFEKSIKNKNMYVSIMNELSMFKEEFNNTLVQAIFSQSNSASLYGDIKSFKKMIEEIVDIYHNNKNKIEEVLWLQVNTVSGKVMSNNSTSCLGDTVPIDNSTVGSMIKNLSVSDKTSEWLMMHGFTNCKVMASGSSLVGEKPLSSQDPSVYTNTRNLYGLYKCQMVEIQLNNKFIPRAGYDSNVLDDLYYSVEYFSTGKNKNVGKGWRRAPVNVDKKGRITTMSEEIKRNMHESEELVAERIKKYGGKRKYKRPRDIGESTGHGLYSSSITSMGKGTMLSDDRERGRRFIDKEDTIESARRSALGREAPITSLKRDKSSGEHTEKSTYSKDHWETIHSDIKDTSVHTHDMDMTSPGKHKDSPEDNIIDESVKDERTKYDRTKCNELSSINGVNDKINHIHGSDRKFTIVRNKGGGDCLWHALTDFYKDARKIEGVSNSANDIGIITDGTYQSPETAMAFNMLHGVSTVIHRHGNEGKTYCIINGSDEVCNLLFKNNHFEYMRPDKGGNYASSSADSQTLLNIPVTDIHTPVAVRMCNYLVERDVVARIKRQKYGDKIKESDIGENMSSITIDENAKAILEGGDIILEIDGELYDRGEEPFTYVN